MLQVYIPKVDSRIHDVDRLLSRIPGVVGSVAPFRYLVEHQESLGKFIVAALIGGNIGEHLQFDRILPRVRRYDAGNLETSIQTHLQLTEELVDRTLRYVTSTALKVQELGKSA